MANLFSVGDQVVCQKLGGQTGSKPLSPAFPGRVAEVKPGGTEYLVVMKNVNRAHTPLAAHFKGSIVKEEFITAA